MRDIRSIVLALTKLFVVYIMRIARIQIIENMINENTVSYTDAEEKVGSIAPIDRLNSGQLGELPLH